MELEEFLLKAKEKPSKWNEFFDKLLDSTVYVLASEKTETSVSPQDVPLLTMSDNLGRQVIPFFTSEEKMKAIKGVFNVGKIKGISLFKAMREQALLLNPNSDTAKLFTPFEVKVLSLEYEKKHN